MAGSTPAQPATGRSMHRPRRQGIVRKATNQQRWELSCGRRRKRHRRYLDAAPSAGGLLSPFAGRSLTGLMPEPFGPSRPRSRSGLRPQSATFVNMREAHLRMPGRLCTGAM